MLRDHSTSLLVHLWALGGVPTAGRGLLRAGPDLLVVEGLLDAATGRCGTGAGSGAGFSNSGAIWGEPLGL